VQRARQLVCLLFAATGLFMLFGGYGLGLTGEFGPGPGFFAFGIGIFLTLSSLIWFATLARIRVEMETQIVEDRRGLLRVGKVALSLAAFAILVERLGFNLTMLALLLFLLTAFDRERLVLKIVVAFAGSFGTHYVFEQLLRVPLPSSSIGFLQSLGL
jgi:putative tricarboxylic transport membrane protein